MILIKTIIGAFVSILACGLVYGQGTGMRTLKEMGCHLGDGTCYVSIEGDPVGPDSCKSNSIRWHSLETNGKHMLALITAAKMQNKKIDFYISSNCYAYQNLYPTLRYLHIEP